MPPDRLISFAFANGTFGSEGAMCRRIIVLVLSSTLVVEARANLANFNALTVGTIYAPGSLFSNGGLDFDVLFGLGNVTVNAASGLANPTFAGNYLRLGSNNGLNVNLPTGASQIQFDFIQNNVGVALVVNGGWLDFSQIPGTVNGVTVSKVTPATNWGNLSATGNINSFLIVGTEFLVDNVNVTQIAGLSGDYNKNLIVD